MSGTICIQNNKPSKVKQCASCKEIFICKNCDDTGLWKLHPKCEPCNTRHIKIESEKKGRKMKLYDTTHKGGKSINLTLAQKEEIAPRQINFDEVSTESLSIVEKPGKKNSSSKSKKKRMNLSSKNVTKNDKRIQKSDSGTSTNSSRKGKDKERGIEKPTLTLEPGDFIECRNMHISEGVGDNKVSGFVLSTKKKPPRIRLHTDQFVSMYCFQIKRTSTIVDNRSKRIPDKEQKWHFFDSFRFEDKSLSQEHINFFQDYNKSFMKNGLDLIEKSARKKIKKILKKSGKNDLLCFMNTEDSGEEDDDSEEDEEKEKTAIRKEVTSSSEEEEDEETEEEKERKRKRLALCKDIEEALDVGPELQQYMRKQAFLTGKPLPSCLTPKVNQLTQEEAKDAEKEKEINTTHKEENEKELNPEGKKLKALLEKAILDDKKALNPSKFQKK